MESTTAVIRHVQATRYVSPLRGVSRLLYFSDAVGDKGWVTSTCAMNPLENSAAIRPKMTGIEFISVFGFHGLQKTGAHHGSLELEFWYTQLSEGATLVCLLGQDVFPGRRSH